MDPADKLDALVPRQQAISAAIAGGDSDVQRFYSGRTVFLTGGSGFLGKQLIEKLMRSCKPSKVYMLLRPKKEKSIEQRLQDILQEPVFDTLKKQQPDFTDKIVAVEGDVAEINLGLSNEDWKTLTEEVEVLFHVAATTRFDESLRVATMINLRGTRECLKLGKACKKLSSYVHVSTAYTHAKSTTVGGEVSEKFYECPIPPDTMISLADIDDDRLVGITDNLIKDWPNTYTFTKAIAEELIRTTSDGLPICIVRPGIVISSYLEPSGGWIDENAVYSASGIIVGTFVGLLHTIHVNEDIKTGLIPCDFVNNTILAAGKEVAASQAKGGNNTVIYNMTSTNSNPILWKNITKILGTEGEKFTTPLEIYYAYMLETKNRMLYKILTLFLHILPAYFADFLCIVMGKRRRFAKMAKKVYKMCDSFSYFLQSDWIFVDKNTTSLYNSLSKRDQTIFNFNVNDIHWNELIIMWLFGLRKYVLKDGLTKTDYPFNRHRTLRIVHYAVMSIYVYVIWKMFYFSFWIGRAMFQLIL